MNLADIAERYRQYAILRHLKPRGLERNCRDFLQLGGLTRQHVLELEARLHARYAPRTAFEKLGRALTVLAWCARQGYCNAVQLERLCPPRPSVAALSIDQVQRLIEAAHGRLRVVLELLYGTGLRVGEVARLRVEDIDWEPPVLQVRNAKGGKARVVPLGSHLVSVLRPYVDGIGSGTLFHKMDMTHAVIDLGRRIGIKVSPHALRRAYATHLLRHGATLSEVGRLLGHTHLQSTVPYTTMDQSDLQRSLQQFHPRC